MTKQQIQPTFANDTIELAESLRDVIGRFVRNVRTGAGTPTSAQSETLGLLDRNGPLSVAGMAQTRNVKHQSMRLVVAQLEGDGLVERLADPQDRRSQLVSITPKGKEALSSSRGARVDWIATALESELTEEERQVLRQSIGILAKLGEAGA
ncbi:MarR family winged helix-turn-helix transcriptional regulator [Neorhizobium alkalisoli]|uniref:DNA-binding MarR family transcriptional regulator n=1 Tax=Neorhizobium alkalisoli TaxID=528178 RepID=A0A561QNV2_9HYPH|nr:MarR family transcriptional regulator [Neorhizobium alkalisoli]TWF52058.1 DNA-binding MarR family transcriptional regulator [Neorhizobium alkalisoli]